jgi:hypothetical protein
LPLPPVPPPVPPPDPPPEEPELEELDISTYCV